MNGVMLITGLIFVLVTLVSLISLSSLDSYSKRKGISERIRRVTLGYNETDKRESKWRRRLVRLIHTLGQKLRPKKDSDISRMRKKLMQAGYHGENSVLVFFGSKGLLALVLTALVLLARVLISTTLPGQQFAALLILSAAGGFYLPDLFLRQRTELRKKRIFEGFPDALDLMVVCVEAGMGLDAAIKRVGDEIALRNRILSEEFRLLSLELRGGKTRIEALRNLAMRADLEDVSSLVTLLIQTDRFGTRITQALRVHSEAMRTKRYQRAEEIAAKLPVKLVFPLVFFIFPAIFVAVLGPAAISIYRNVIHPMA